ncbi:MAG TPA: UDP-N-acetylglucosamine 2-epimerase (non-hydrolyzing) [Firmicutes bacterium]|nr:UDP-N-acetylglucosamine 2-epimerase (non-hydrolyzing) [Bacillota bacterium]
MLKIALVFGTRPEAIKMAPVVKEFQNVTGWEAKVIVTGQHREMLDQVLGIFGIKPDFDLNIMRHGQSLSAITVRVLEGISGIFKEWRPDLVLVHGDTTTAFAAALASFYERIPVAHVEAGLRTPTVANPFPEEANRRLIDVFTTTYFAPTEKAAQNLRNEGVAESRIFVTGNTVIDALLSVMEEDYKFEDTLLRSLEYGKKPLMVVTAHRRENWGKPLQNICEALLEISAANDCEIVVAMHRNPALQRVMQKYLADKPNIYLIEAPAYREFANLLNKCTLLLTDSGGLQEEAPALGKPVLVMREVTERPEGIEAGTVKLVGTKKEKIIETVNRLLRDEKLYDEMSKAQNPYGDGTAAKQIRRIIEKEYKLRENSYDNETR